MQIVVAVVATSFWVIALAITGGRGLRPILPLRWISRLATGWTRANACFTDGCVPRL